MTSHPAGDPGYLERYSRAARRDEENRPRTENSAVGRRAAKRIGEHATFSAGETGVHDTVHPFKPEQAPSPLTPINVGSLSCI